MNVADIVGYIPTFLSESDPRSAKEQIDTAYAHGGGWEPFNGFTMDKETGTITYPGDPPMKPAAIAKLHDETIVVYPYAWVAIFQKDGSYEIARID